MCRKQKFSANWRKARDRIQRIHARIGNARRDYLHKTSTAISQNHAMVCIEDLQVRNMSRSAAGSIETPGKQVRAKAGLNRAILDQGWFEFRRQLEYKLSWKWRLADPRAAAEHQQKMSAMRPCLGTEPADTSSGSPALHAVSRRTPIGSARSTFSGRDTPVAPVK